MSNTIQFTTISATKGLIRDLRSKGIKVEALKKDRSEIASSIYDTDQKRIGISLTDSHPRSSLWHEAGHAISDLSAGHTSALAKSIKSIKRRGNIPLLKIGKDARSEWLEPGSSHWNKHRAAEIEANTIAQAEMKKRKVPQEAIQKYRDTVAPFLNTYRSGNLGRGYLDLRRPFSQLFSDKLTKPNTTMNQKHLLQLSANLDQVIQFRREEDEDESHLLRNTAITGSATVGGLYGLGRKATAALPYGPLPEGVGRGIGATIGRGATRVGDKIVGTAERYADIFSKGLEREGGGILRGVRGMARHATKGKSRFVGLSAELDSIINFDWMDIAKRVAPGLGKAALRWGGIGAAGGALAGGVSGAMSDDPNSSALGGALKGAAAGGLLGAAGGAGVRGYKIQSRLASRAAKPAMGVLGGTREAAAAARAPSVPGYAKYEAGLSDEKLAAWHKFNKDQTALSSRHARLMELSAGLDEVVEFGRGGRIPPYFNTGIPERYNSHSKGVALRLIRHKLDLKDVRPAPTPALPGQPPISKAYENSVRHIASGNSGKPDSHVRAAREWLTTNGYVKP